MAQTLTMLAPTDYTCTPSGQDLQGKDARRLPDQSGEDGVCDREDVDVDVDVDGVVTLVRVEQLVLFFSR